MDFVSKLIIHKIRSRFWLDRSNLRISPKGFKNFETWSQELFDQEARELKNRKQFVNIEVEWANRGVKARVKRNIKRMERAKKLKEQLFFQLYVYL